MYTILDSNIVFLFEKAGVFDDVRHLSAFMAKNAANKEGQPLLEQYAISEDEEPMFNLCLRDCLPDVWEIMVKLTHGVEDAYVVSKFDYLVKEKSFAGGAAIPANKYYAGSSEESDTYKNLRYLISGEKVYFADSYASGAAQADVRYFEPDDSECVIFRIVDNGAYNANILKIVEASIQSTMEQGVLEKWYTRIAQADLLKMASLGFASESSTLARRLMQLLRKSVYPPQV